MLEKKKRVPFDKLWKDVVSENISDFLAMFLPDLHELVDYTVPIEFLEQELKSALKDKTYKLADKLVKLRLKSGEEEWVFVHVEFETKPPTIIGKRMFDYFYRIREKYNKDITAIVIYTGSDVPKVFDRYEYERFGTSFLYKFNSYQVRLQKEEELGNNPNAFAVVVLANLYVLQTKDNPEKRLSLKEHIYEIARQRNYSEEKISSLITFITELMVLPDDLGMKFNEYISKSTKKSTDMYITNATRSLVETLERRDFGKTASEMNATIVNTIVRLYSKLKMSIDEIAEVMDIEAKVVYDTLKKQKLVK